MEISSFVKIICFQDCNKIFDDENSEINLIKKISMMHVQISSIKFCFTEFFSSCVNSFSNIIF